jgi:very-short-patch-repair endonuclease
MKPTSIARKLRNNRIDAEIMLWSAIKNRKLGGFKFRRQAPIGKYVVGFVCHKKSFIIEADGGQYIGKYDSGSKRNSCL